MVIGLTANTIVIGLTADYMVMLMGTEFGSLRLCIQGELALAAKGTAMSRRKLILLVR